jgi:hypothetical protein
MKKAKIIIGAIVVAIMSFMGGAYTSYYFMGLFIEELAKPYANVGRYTSEVMDDYATAYMMYQNHNEEALDIVNNRIDVNIIVLDEKMTENDNDSSIENAINTIKRVKSLRDKQEYMNRNDEIQQRLEEIYKKYVTEE